jgi:tRNA pseudouridine32 synthase/23S rRNA pseudouridine746 synthase
MSETIEQKPFSVKRSVKEGDPLVLIDFLELHTKLSKSILKKVLNNGGVWLRKFSSSKRLRVRRATTELNAESHVEFFFDPRYLNLEVAQAREIKSNKQWGIWYKPPGLLSQGTDFGDNASILRQVEKTKHDTFLVHRLDREAHGLMVFAYTQKAAAVFSKMWQDARVEKYYKVEVLGRVADRYPNGGTLEFRIDGKDAKTTYTILETREHTTVCLAQIHTGRLHQVRRHFEELGYPVIGDPKYGQGNKNAEGLKLLAYQLKFRDPFTKEEINCQLSDVVF